MMETLPHPPTPRELQVLGLSAAGNQTKEIAALLFLSAATIKNHKCRALKKLGARNTTHAVALAVSRGLIEFPA